MKASKPTLIATLSTLALTLAACDRGALTGPPNLRLGRDECAECGMIINEERCSSALLVERAGRREHLMYDDIGCMLDAERTARCGPVIERFVHDHESRKWVRAEAASFLAADTHRLQTPMGSGLVAFETFARAEAAFAAYGGTLLAHSDLAATREAWLAARQRAAPR